MSTQNNAVEVNSGAVLSKAAVITGLVVLALVVSVGAFSKVGLGVPGPHTAQVTPFVTPDAGSFELLAKPVPLPQITAATDAGTKAKFDPSDRRGEFAVRMDALAVDIGTRYADTVKVEKIYFATNNTEKADAAVVAFRAEKIKQTTVVFFIFQNDTWKTFPTDFQ